MRYVYPAVLYPDKRYVGVKIPDLPDCFTYGRSNAEALVMAKAAMEMWLWDAENNHETIPVASKFLDINEGEILTLIAADTCKYRKLCEAAIPQAVNHAVFKEKAAF